MSAAAGMPDRDCQRRIAWRRIASLVAALSALAFMAAVCSLRPRWQQEIGPPLVNLGTAQMQAEVMALAIRQLPPPRIPALPIPLMPLSATANPEASPLRGVATAAPTPSTPVDRWRRLQPPQLADPVWEDIYVMEQTLPYCWPGSRASTCQEVEALVQPLDDRWPPQIRALRLRLEAALIPTNRRPTSVPNAALAGAQRMNAAGLRALRERGCASTVQQPSHPSDQFVHLTRPVFSGDGQWAMIAVAWDSCVYDFVYRELVVLHRETGRWMTEDAERGLGAEWNGRVLRPWQYNH